MMPYIQYGLILQTDCYKTEKVTKLSNIVDFKENYEIFILHITKNHTTPWIIPSTKSTDMNFINLVKFYWIFIIENLCNSRELIRFLKVGPTF